MKRFAVIVREKPRNIFEDDKMRVDLKNRLQKLQREVPSWIAEPLSEPRDRETLARAAADNEVTLPPVLRPVMLRHIGHVRHVRVMVCQDRRRELVDIGEAHRRPAEPAERDARGLDPAEDRDVPHRFASPAFSRRTSAARSRTAARSRETLWQSAKPMESRMYCPRVRASCAIFWSSSASERSWAGVIVTAPPRSGWRASRACRTGSRPGAASGRT